MVCSIVVPSLVTFLLVLVEFEDVITCELLGSIDVWDAVCVVWPFEVVDLLLVIELVSSSLIETGMVSLNCDASVPADKRILLVWPGNKLPLIA